MKTISIVVSITILLSLVCSSSSSSDSHVQYVIRNTKSGSIRGTIEQVLGRNVSIFLGVPFAKPPVGELRFKRPERLPKWDHVRNATQLPASCYQEIDDNFDQFRGVDMWNPNTERSEDCLYLNVWQPVTTDSASSSKKTKKAVMVWIYGGGFYSGTSTLELYDARILAAKGDVVVVSMQYRLGPLGFLYLGTAEAPGNQGLLDQHLALQWVRENIDSFDGDPDRVTLFGESAGAFSVSLHLLSPLSRDLVRSGIMQSASSISPWGLDTPTIARQRTMDLARISRCHSEQDTEIVKCLRGIDAGRLTSDQLLVKDDSIIFTAFTPTIDNYFLKELPIETLKKGDLKKDSILLGVNRDEGFYFLAYSQTLHFDLNASSVVRTEDYEQIVSSLLGSSKTRLLADSVAFEYGAPYFTTKQSALYRKALDDILGDISFKCPVVDLALYYARNAAISVYMYEFNHRTSANPWPSWMGVMHGYEIDHVFGMPLNASLKYAQHEKRLSEEIIQYWTNFAKTG